MSNVDNPYERPRIGGNPARGTDRVEYADGTAARRGDSVLDPRGRRLKVIGMDGSRGRLMTLDADFRMVGVDARAVEVVERG